MDRRVVFIGLFLIVQLALPLSYYLGDDRYDERFAWRMFSDVRMVRCRADYRIGGAPVRLLERFHVAWQTLVERGRRPVVDAVARRLCRDAGGAPVTLRLECREFDGSTRVLEDGARNLCEEDP